MLMASCSYLVDITISSAGCFGEWSEDMNSIDIDFLFMCLFFFHFAWSPAFESPAVCKFSNPGVQ